MNIKKKNDIINYVGDWEFWKKSRYDILGIVIFNIKIKKK